MIDVTPRIEARRTKGGDAGLAQPILMRVIGGAFNAIAKEMAGVLYRMSYSSINRESEDLGAGLFDPQGNNIAESDSTPMFMGAMPKIVKGVISLLGDDIQFLPGHGDLSTFGWERRTNPFVSDLAVGAA